MMRGTRRFIEKLARIHRAAMWAAQIGIFALSGVLAFLLRFDLRMPRGSLGYLAYALPVWVVTKVVVFRVANLDRGWWRYVSISDLLRMVLGNLTATALSCIVITSIAPAG